MGRRWLLTRTSTSVLTQDRKRVPKALDTPWPLILAVPEMHSQVNLARIVRAAALFGVRDLIVAGQGRMDRDVSLGAESHVNIKPVRSLLHPVKRHRSQGYHIVGLEQTARSHSLFSFKFRSSPTVLVVGHERHGVTDELLAVCDDVVEIPTYGTHLGSHNASSACMMALYEFVRQKEASSAADESIV